MANRPGRAFFAAITLYFAAQFALRLGLGGALETDEAEMMVMTPGLRLGYGPQLPLYNWLQVLTFAGLGRNLAALAALKVGILWATYAFVFLGLRVFCSASEAALGALALFLVPDIAFEAQRATTHSNMLLVTSAATLAAFLWALRTGRTRSWLALGLAIGFGGLSKYNYWTVPLALAAATLVMPGLHARLDRRAVWAAAVAAAVVAAPYGWIVATPELAMASVRKLSLDGAVEAGPGRLAGLIDMADGLFQMLALLGLVAVVFRLINRRPSVRVPWPAAFLGLAAGTVVLLFVSGTVLVDAGNVTPRWLLPVTLLAAPAAGLWALAGAGPRLVAGFLALLLILAGLVVAGLVIDRYKPDARRAVDFAPLPAKLARVADMPATPVVAGFYTAGNLARLRPGWSVTPYLPLAARRYAGEVVLFLFREDVPDDLAAGLRQAGWSPAAVKVLDRGRISLAYETVAGARLPIAWVRARVPGP